MIIYIFTFISIVSAAAFGIYGSLINFRDDNNKIRKQGWIAVAGVISSAVLGASLQIYSEASANQQSLALLKKNSQILNDVRRTQHPLDDIIVEYKIKPNWDSPYLSDVFAEFKNRHSNKGSVKGSSIGIGFNTADKYPLLYDILNEIDIVIHILKDPISPEKFTYHPNFGSSYGDLIIHVENPDSTYESSYSDSYSLLYHITRDGRHKESYLKVRNNRIEPNSYYWESNGKVISVFDLLGSQIIIQITERGLNLKSDNDEELVYLLRREVELNEVVLRIGNGMTLFLDNNSLEKHYNPLRFNYYSYTFPEVFEDFLKATNYDPDRHFIE